MNTFSVCIPQVNKRFLYIEIEEKNVLYGLFEYEINES